MAEGVTTLEIKSGYGLSLEHETRCLAVARSLGQTLPLSVRTSYLGAHALPPEFEGRSDDYIQAVCDWLPLLHAQGLVDAVDAFCDTIGFTPAQTRRVFAAAQALGLPVKLHAEQLSDQGGAALAATFNALSCDHLEHLSPQGIAAMAHSASVAVLLPAAYYFLRDTQPPPIAALRAQAVPMALATDHNPGSAPGLSLLLMLNMACTLFRLTPLEALQGVTVHAARALGLHDRGTLQAGQRADFCTWDIAHPRELAYWFGRNLCQRVIFAGQERTL
jgi:imidazolonepropionase